jgi:hypothetical protein
MSATAVMSTPAASQLTAAERRRGVHAHRVHGRLSTVNSYLFHGGQEALPLLRDPRWSASPHMS